MTSRTTYESSVTSAGAAKLVTVGNAETTFQTACNASGCDVGLVLANGNAAFITAQNAAAIARRETRWAAEQAKQAALAAARDTLRTASDFGPV